MYKAKIKKQSSSWGWYNDLIGQEVVLESLATKEVKISNSNHYTAYIAIHNGQQHVIRKEDVEIIDG